MAILIVTRKSRAIDLLAAEFRMLVVPIASVAAYFFFEWNQAAWLIPRLLSDLYKECALRDLPQLNMSGAMGLTICNLTDLSCLRPLLAVRPEGANHQ